MKQNVEARVRGTAVDLMVWDKLHSRQQYDWFVRESRKEEFQYTFDMMT